MASVVLQQKYVQSEHTANFSTKALLEHTVVSAGWELTINVFPPGQVLKEYCRVEAMGDATGILSCTGVDKEQQIYCADSLEVPQIWSA
jgi:hypothetical protein